MGQLSSTAAGDPSTREAHNPQLLSKLLLLDTFSSPKPVERASLKFGLTLARLTVLR